MTEKLGGAHYVRSIGACRFAIDVSSDTMAYVDRVFAGSYSHDRHFLPDNSFKIEVDERTGNATKLLEAAQDIEELPGGILRGSTGNGRFIHLSGVYLDILYPDPDFAARRVIFSKKPEYGIVSFMKSAILRKYVTQNDAVVFHAGGILKKEDGPSFVVTAYDNEKHNGDNSGKTTLVLATTLRDDPSFDYASNDEVILGRDKKNKTKYMKFPSQITVREGTLSRLHASGIYPILEEWNGRDKITGQRTNIITPSNLLMYGSNISALNTSNMRWCFLDLTPDDSDNKVRFYRDDSERRRLVFNAISKRRMAVGYSPLYLGESIEPGLDIGTRIQNAFDAVYETIKKNESGYYVIRGGMNRDKLNSLMKRLI